MNLIRNIYIYIHAFFKKIYAVNIWFRKMFIFIYIYIFNKYIYIYISIFEFKYIDINKTNTVSCTMYAFTFFTCFFKIFCFFLLF